VRILFVCNANIVRSFMAERVLKSRLMHHGIHGVEVSSAGLLDMKGAPADMTARQILQENGIDDQGHQSRFLNEAIIGEADLVVPMAQEQLQRIGDQYPLARDKMRVLKSYLPNTDQVNIAGDVKDPYRRSLFDYRLCFAEISLSLEELIKCI
jgi:protein-tyrosine phosphatase